MIEQSIVHLPELVKDIDRPVSNYLVHLSRCTLAYMHHPLYATGTRGLEPRVKPLWQILYKYGAEVMLNGHDHRYERLARIDPNDNPDPKHGFRPLIAGTGGDPSQLDSVRNHCKDCASLRCAPTTGS